MGLARAATPLIAALILVGCASTPLAEEAFRKPIVFRTLPGAPAVRDARAAFRSVFCSTLHADLGMEPAGLECDGLLWRLRDEPAADPDFTAKPVAAEQIEVGLVTGAFSECVDDQSRPLAAGADRLQLSGARVRTITVGGRSGTEHSARQIAAALSAAPAYRALLAKHRPDHRHRASDAGVATGPAAVSPRAIAGRRGGFRRR